MNSDGALEVLDGDGTGETGGSWMSTGVSLPLAEGRSDEFLRLTLRQDFREGKRTWDLYAEGKLVVADAGLWTAEANDLRRFSLMGHSEFPLVIDNVTISGANMLFADADVDGLPDDWQQQLGANNNRDDDADGDGQSNLEAYLASLENRTEPEEPGPVVPVDGEGRLPESPTDKQFLSAGILALPYFRDGRPETPGEREALAALLNAFFARAQWTDTRMLEAHCETYPDSPFGIWLKANIGYMAYRGGWFHRGEEWLRKAWEEAGEQGYSFDPLVSRVGIELMKLILRNDGDPAEAAAVFAEIERGNLQGRVYDHYKSAQYMLASFQRPAGEANCGITAVTHLVDPGNLDEATRDQFDQARLQLQKTSQNVTNFTQLKSLAAAGNVELRAVRRTNRAVFEEACVMHLRSNHFVLLLPQPDGRMILSDPSFGDSIYVSEDILEAEASGYYLVPGGSFANGADWRETSAAEEREILGKISYGNQSDRDDPCDCICPPDSGAMPTPMGGGAGGGGAKPPGESGGGPGGPGGSPVPGSRAGNNPFRVALSLRETPLVVNAGYDRPFELTFSYAEYTQHDLDQNNGGSLPNIGPKWTSLPLSYVVANGSNLEVFLPSGRKETHLGGSGGYSEHHMSLTTMTSVTGGYKRTATDGSYIEYTNKLTAGGKDYYFIKKIHEDIGYEITVNWSGGAYPRPDTMVDSYGRSITFLYTGGGFRMTGAKQTGSTTKTMTLEYENFGSPAEKRIKKVNYAVYMPPTTVAYDGTTGNITSRTTPYGTTTYTREDSPLNYKVLKTKDPEGFHHWVAYLQNASGFTNMPAGIDSDESAADLEIPTLFEIGVADKNDIVHNSTYVWDKKAMKDLGYIGNQTPSSGNEINFTNGFGFDHARHTHWLDEKNNAAKTVGIPSSTRSALTWRQWYKYAGQPAATQAGTTSQATIAAHRVRDKNQSLTVTNPTIVTAKTSISYNSKGNPTIVGGPKGRTVKTEYHTGNVNPSYVKQLVSGTYKILGWTGSYNSQNLPLQAKDASGNLTQMTYNGYGQVLTVTDANGDVTEFVYKSGSGSSTYGALDVIKRKKSGTSTWVTLQNVTAWDSHGRPSTIDHGADAYTLTYTYDDLDRVTRIDHPNSTYETWTYQNNGTGTNIFESGQYRDRNGRLTKYTYNGNRRLVKVDDPEHSGHTEYEWCSCGHLETLKDPKGQITTWHRDLLGRVTSKDYPAVSGSSDTITYSYYPESGLLAEVIPKRQWSNVLVVLRKGRNAAQERLHRFRHARRHVHMGCQPQTDQKQGRRHGDNQFPLLFTGHNPAVVTVGGSGEGQPVLHQRTLVQRLDLLLLRQTGTHQQAQGVHGLHGPQS